MLTAQSIFPKFPKSARKLTKISYYVFQKSPTLPDFVNY